MSTVTLFKRSFYDRMLRPSMARSLVPVLDCLRDKRGVSALMFVASSAFFFGLAGFGMEVSAWYLERRHGQNAADAAAIAGVLGGLDYTTTTISGATGFSNAQTAGISVATDNGYTSGSNTTVTIQPGNWSGGSFTADSSGSCSPSCNAVQAQMVRAEPRSFSSFIVGSGSQNVRELATAAVLVTGPACALALGGGLAFSGNGSVTGTNCSLASNRTGGDSITFNGAGANKTQTNLILVGAGGCTQSGSATPCTAGGNLMYQPPTTDPYAALQDPSAIPAEVNSTNCTNSTTAQSPYVISSGVFCVGKTLTVHNAGDSAALPSGTYFFFNSGITVSGGTLSCSGCTFIFTGPSPNYGGSSILNITGGTVNMSAPATASYPNTNYNGMLFYADYRNSQHTSSCGSAPVSIQGSSTITLNGGMYFPNASVCVTGNTFSSSTTCMSIVGWSLTFTGSATENVTGCGTTTKTAQVQAIALVQ
ncbi:pilus assembly protein TadG-related protein [Bradyrhizobium sp. PMVTL-01]|uniref:pilus assembly protein TadG-related protein n=1 Tax=Bradyrhizobium sp. PMVTL-01 TaxID=3434999 RepID=UPI003F6EE7AF